MPSTQSNMVIATQDSVGVDNDIPTWFNMTSFLLFFVFAEALSNPNSVLNWTSRVHLKRNLVQTVMLPSRWAKPLMLSRPSSILS